MLDPIQYEFLFLFTTLADPEPEPKTSRFRLLAAPAPQHWYSIYTNMYIRWWSKLQFPLLSYVTSYFFVVTNNVIVTF